MDVLAQFRIREVNFDCGAPFPATCDGQRLLDIIIAPTDRFRRTVDR
jgi:hypothetical protein